jgi:hypothetical protein
MASGWYARNRDVLGLLERGEISLLDLAVDDFLRLSADYRTGLTYTSAEKIRALCPRGIGLREIQRSLARLEALGRIKRMRKSSGKKGNYPVVLGQFFVRDLSHNWLRVNLEKTIDYRQIAYDSVSDPSEVGHCSVVADDTHVSPTAHPRVTDVTPLKEEEIETDNQDSTKKTEAEEAAAADFGNPKIADPVEGVIGEMQAIYRKRWKRGFAVAAKTRPELETLITERGSDTVLQAFRLFIADDTDDFLAENRHPLASFTKRVEVYIRPAERTAPAEPMVEFEGRMVPAWVRDSTLQERQAMADKHKKREEQELADRETSTALQERYGL